MHNILSYQKSFPERKRWRYRDELETETGKVDIGRKERICGLFHSDLDYKG